MWISISCGRSLQSLPKGRVNQSQTKVLTDRSLLPRIRHLSCLSSNLSLCSEFNIICCEAQVWRQLPGTNTLSHSKFSLSGSQAFHHGNVTSPGSACVYMHVSCYVVPFPLLYSLVWFETWSIWKNYIHTNIHASSRTPSAPAGYEPKQVTKLQ